MVQVGGVRFPSGECGPPAKGRRESRAPADVRMRPQRSAASGDSLPTCVANPNKSLVCGPMRILLRGRQTFLVDSLAEAAQKRGHAVTRLLSEALAFGQGAGIERTPALPPKGSLDEGHWDVVIVAEIGQPQTESWNLEQLYGLASQVVLVTSAQHSLTIPSTHPTLFVSTGVLVGPGDPNGSLTYWVNRMARGGTVMAFGKPGRTIKSFLDVRDAADWIIQSAETNRIGSFAALGEQVTIGEFLETVRSITGADAQIVYVNDEFLTSNRVEPARELPLWTPEKVMEVDLPTPGWTEVHIPSRPLKQTIQDALASEAAGSRGASGAEVGLSDQREQQLLANWSKHASGSRKHHGRAIEFLMAALGAILVTAALITFLEHRGWLDPAIDAVRRMDRSILTLLGTFQPSMLVNFYGERSREVYAQQRVKPEGWMQMVTIIFILVGATPWVLKQLYLQGGVVNLAGGLITLAFGIGFWPIAARSLGWIGKHTSGIFPELERNAKLVPGLVVGRSVIVGLILFMIPVVILSPDTSMATKVIWAIASCAGSLYMASTVVRQRYEKEENFQIFGSAGIAQIGGLLVVLIITGYAGTLISAGLQWGLQRAIASADLLILQLRSTTFLLILGILDMLHIGKSAREAILEFIRLRR